METKRWLPTSRLATGRKEESFRKDSLVSSKIATALLRKRYRLLSSDYFVTFYAEARAFRCVRMRIRMRRQAFRELLPPPYTASRAFASDHTPAAMSPIPTPEEAASNLCRVTDYLQFVNFFICVYLSIAAQHIEIGHDSLINIFLTVAISSCAMDA
jgi:hypothetical protein